MICHIHLVTSAFKLKKMKNRIFYSCMFILILIFSVSLKAQNQEPVIATVKYKFSQVLDTTNLSDVYTEDMLLYIGKTASLFQSYDKMVDDSLPQFGRGINKGKNTSTARYSPLGYPSFTAPQFRPVTTTAYYFYTSDHTWLQKNLLLLNNYISPLPSPDINWEIKSDTMSISGLKCQKATGYWKGRTYTAWFCPDLPFSYGPWKLNGLPGLILQAYDGKKQVVFDFAGFEKNKDINKMIAFPPNKTSMPPNRLIMATVAEWERLYNLMWQEPRTVMEMEFGQKILNPVNHIDPGFVKPKPFKNPIEFEEKK